MLKWLLGRGASQRDVAQTAARIPAALWQRMFDSYPFLHGLDTAETDNLKERTAWVLASKRFSGAHGLEPTDEMMLSIAIQAALPILHLSPSLYEGWTEIIIYPGGFVIPREHVTEDGVVHEYMQVASGEAWDGGPVIISWEDAHDPACHGNVVIHEFAHKIDLASGVADGVPFLAGNPALSPGHWKSVLVDAFEAFNQALDEVEASIPAHIDPESRDADPWYDQLPLDPYAATDLAEFFAVSSEAFFVDPHPLALAYPEWYGLLAAFYRQDPRTRLSPPLEPERY